MTYRNRAGGSWSAATTVDDQSLAGGKSCYHPGIAFDDSGRICATWLTGINDASADATLYIRVYSGGSWGTTDSIAGSNMWVGIDTGTRPYVDASGSYHIAYLNGSKQIQYKYSDDQGATWSANNPGSGTASAMTPA